MKQIYTIVILMLISISSASAMNGKYLDTQKNQVILINNNKISTVTTRGNIPPSGSEKECLSYLKNKINKTCISYQIIVPNFDDEFGIFIRQELGSQELISKNVFLYNFQTKKIVDVTLSLPEKLQKAGNFRIWYGSYELYYTIWNWNTQSYETPNSFSPTVFKQNLGN